MLNTVCVMGWLTADPKIRRTQNDKALANFTLACNRPARSGEDAGADFIDVTAWNKTAEFVGKYFFKGQLVAVDGSIRTGSYTDKDGVKRKSFEIWANNVHFAEAKRAVESSSKPQEVGYEDVSDEDLPF